MAELKYLTVVYKYVDSDNFREWFQKEVSARNCAVKENQNKLIQVTSWYDGDALEDLHEHLYGDRRCLECGQIYQPKKIGNTICNDCFTSGCGESV